MRELTPGNSSISASNRSRCVYDTVTTESSSLKTPSASSKVDVTLSAVYRSRGPESFLSTQPPFANLLFVTSQSGTDGRYRPKIVLWEST